MAQAVSWARAEQTNYWHPGEDDRAPGHEPRFDFKHIDGLVQRIEEHDAAWQRWFTTWDISPHLVRYEDLAEPTRGTSPTTSSTISGSTSPTIGRSPLADRRQADEVNDDWIARYRALT